MSKETYYSVKRDLLQCQKTPSIQVMMTRIIVAAVQGGGERRGTIGVYQAGGTGAEGKARSRGKKEYDQ